MSDPIIIALASQKGGVGKSTLATQFAFCSAVKSKKKTLLVDFDAQGNATSALLGHGQYNGTPVRDLFSSDCPPLFPQTNDYGVDVIGSLGGEVQDYSTETLTEEEVFNPAINLDTIANNYDFIWLDCPPSLGARLTGALYIAQYLICPIKLGPYATDGVVGLQKTIDAVNQNRKEPLKLLGMIVNDYDRSGYDMIRMQLLREDNPRELLFNNNIRSRSPIKMAGDFAKPIWDLPNSKTASEEVLAAYHEILKKI